MNKHEGYGDIGTGKAKSNRIAAGKRQMVWIHTHTVCQNLWLLSKEQCKLLQDTLATEDS